MDTSIYGEFNWDQFSAGRTNPELNAKATSLGFANRGAMKRAMSGPAKPNAELQNLLSEYSSSSLFDGMAAIYQGRLSDKEAIQKNVAAGKEITLTSEQISRIVGMSVSTSISTAATALSDPGNDAKLLQQVTSLEADKQQLQNEKNQIANDLLQANQELLAKQTELDALKNTEQTLEQTLQDRDQEITTLKSNLTTAQDEAKNAADALLTTGNPQAAKDLAANNKVSDLENQLQAANDAKVKAEAGLAKIQDEKTALEEQIKTLSSEKDGLEKELSEVQGQLADAEKAHTQAQTSFEAEKEKADGLQAQLDAANQAKAKIEGELKNLKASNSTDDSVAQLQAKNEEIARLTNELAQVKLNLTDSQTKLEANDKALKQALSIADLVGQYATLFDAASKLTGDEAKPKMNELLNTVEASKSLLKAERLLKNDQYIFEASKQSITDALNGVITSLEGSVLKDLKSDIGTLGKDSYLTVLRDRLKEINAAKF